MGEWRVEWVPDPDGWGSAPPGIVLGVEDLPGAVALLGLRPGDPVFLAPDGSVDRDLLDYVRSPVFQRLQRETRRNYATDMRLLLSFLSARGVSLRAATWQDLRDYRHWRCSAPQNPQRISGTKWNREAAAFTKLFTWAGVRPLPIDVSRLEDRAPDAVSSRVSWLTPRTWGLWSNVGLRGHDGGGAPTAEWMSRTELRNTSFVQLLVSSGLRRQEGGALLTFELPSKRRCSGSYLHGQVAGALTRAKRSRTYYASARAVAQVEAYVESERAWAIQRAQGQGRYDDLPQRRLITGITHGVKPMVHWVGADGVPGKRELALLDWRERQWLFLDGPDGPEPTWLWLTEQGLPMDPGNWNGVFRGANQRCEQVLLTDAERAVDRAFRLTNVTSKSPYATPHSCRHSAALYLLILLNELFESRYGLTRADRRDFALLFGDLWWLVKTILGHQDVETTKRHYLAPVAHLQLESILAAANDTSDDADARSPESVDEVFARLARETSGIQDIDVLVEESGEAG